MGDHTGISWADRTWNPTQGCTKVSDGCKHCYMYRDKRRYGQDPTAIIRSARATFRKPLAKKQDGSWCWPDGDRVFACSWSDWFHEGADEHRADMWEVVRQRPGLVFMLLTKRPERSLGHLPRDWGEGWPQVWLGVTVESDTEMGRLHRLLDIPAALHFVSYEPALGPLHLQDVGHLDVSGLGWVIAGGESGPRARPSRPSWFREVRDTCASADIPYHFKQWGEHDELGRRVGVKRAGRLLDGVVHDAVPKVSRE